MKFSGTWHKTYFHCFGPDAILKSEYKVTVKGYDDEFILTFILADGTELPIKMMDSASNVVSFHEDVGTMRYSGMVFLLERSPKNVFVGVIGRYLMEKDIPNGSDVDMGTFTAVKQPTSEPPPGDPRA